MSPHSSSLGAINIQHDPPALFTVDAFFKPFTNLATKVTALTGRIVNWDKVEHAIGWTTILKRTTKADSGVFFDSLRNCPVMGPDGKVQQVDLLDNLEKLGKKIEENWNDLYDMLGMKECSVVRADILLSGRNLASYQKNSIKIVTLSVAIAAAIEAVADLAIPLVTGVPEALPGQISPNLYLATLCYGFLRGEGASAFRLGIVIVHDFIIKRIPNKATLLAIHMDLLRAGSPTYYLANLLPGLALGLARVFSEPILRWFQTKEIERLKKRIAETTEPRLDRLLEELGRGVALQLGYVDVINKNRKDLTLRMTDETGIGNDVDRIMNICAKIGLLFQPPGKGMESSNRKEKLVPLGGGIFVGIVWNSLSYRSYVLLAGSTLNTSVLMGQLIWMFKQPGYSAAEMHRLVQEKLTAIAVTNLAVGCILYSHGRKAFESSDVLVTVSVLTNVFEQLGGHALGKGVDWLNRHLIEACTNLRVAALAHRRKDGEAGRDEGGKADVIRDTLAGASRMEKGILGEEDTKIW